MYEWQRHIQVIVDEIDACIKRHDDEALALSALSRRLGYSEFHMTRKFKEISGMSFRDYLRQRRLAFALKEVRDGERSMLDIAFDYGFSSHEAFTRAFKAAYGTSPAAFVADARIERAIELLNSTDEPIAHIARAVGCRKPGAFAEAFRRRTGVPPSAYRRRSA